MRSKWIISPFWTIFIQLIVLSHLEVNCSQITSDDSTRYITSFITLNGSYVWQKYMNIDNSRNAGFVNRSTNVVSTTVCSYEGILKSMQDSEWGKTSSAGRNCEIIKEMFLNEMFRNPREDSVGDRRGWHQRESRLQVEKSVRG